MAPADKPPGFFQRLFGSSYLPVPTENDDVNAPQVKPKLGAILKSKRVRITGATVLIIAVLGYLYSQSRLDISLDHLRAPPATDVEPPNSPQPPTAPSSPSSPPPPPAPESPDSPKPPNPPTPPSPPEKPAQCTDQQVDWSRYAYTQYVTNTEYLCNSVMLFEILHRLGSKADRLMMYPSTMSVDPQSDSAEARLLLKAQNEYGAKLMPIQVQHRDSNDATWGDSYTKLLAFNQTQYERVLSLDSDSTVLQPMDELFLLPPVPVAMPRAYWMDQPFLSSQMILIQPSVAEFNRVKNAIDNASKSDFDMEIVNNLYGKDCMILPHRRYDLLTGEFRSQGQHLSYLGNDYEKWDPEKMLKEAKFLHFSDWPMPKPWIQATAAVTDDTKPKCDVDADGKEDCRARDMWLGFYSDFKKRRKDICDMDPSLSKRSIDEVARSPWEFEPKFE
ncbi:glycosyltransferase family 8 protein [Xylogone sp. PMI_703]|nr:glycosyltransferase family 8 protein [Xylogone sp. PMI_703]